MEEGCKYCEYDEIERAEPDNGFFGIDRSDNTLFWSSNCLNSGAYIPIRFCPFCGQEFLVDKENK